MIQNDYDQYETEQKGLKQIESMATQGTTKNTSTGRAAFSLQLS